MTQPAVIVTSPEDPIQVVDDVEIDEPRAGEALIELTWAGVCGSDLSLARGTFPHPKPMLLGHEACGRVAALGPGTAGPAEGTRVILWMRPACRACRMCLRGRGELCQASGRMSAYGTLLDGRTSFSRGGEPLHRGLGIGAFTTRLVMPVAGLVEVPDGVSDEVAALLGCGVATGAGAVLNVARPRPGDVVLILGGGGVGLSAAMAAAAVGAGAVVVADPAPQRRQAALDLGATHAIEGGDREAVRSQVSEVLGDPTVDVALDAVGRSELVELAFRTVRQGGTVVAVGVQAGGATVTLPGPVLTLSHKRVLGCYMGGVDPQRDLPILFDLHRRGRFPVDRLIGARRPLAEVPDALDDLAAARGLRTVIQVQR
jgi:S-(hydroxymethyl)glutathione dehydrogenase / alcohol dehydrogenase